MKHNERLDYEPLIIPISKPFSDLNKHEADEYFSWFIDRVDERAVYMCQKVADSLNVQLDQLDYSLESLQLVWKWFLTVAEITKTPKSALNSMRRALSGHPDSFIDQMIEQSKDELSVMTEYVLRDVGMYISKVFLQRYHCLHWSIKYRPKSYVHVNVPLIVGCIDDNPMYPKPFRPDLEPVDLARTPAMNLFEGTQKESDLYDRCMQWVGWIPEG